MIIKTIKNYDVKKMKRHMLHLKKDKNNWYYSNKSCKFTHKEPEQGVIASALIGFFKNE